MGKEEKRILIISIASSIAVDGIGVGLGMMGIISHFWGVFIVIASSVVLIVVLILGVFRAKGDIRPSDVREFQYRIERRKAYLPHLQQALEALLNKQYELTNKAGQVSLEEYRDKFLKLSLKYRILSSSLMRKLAYKPARDEKWIILMALRQENFIKNNLYIRELEQKEDYQILWREYNKWYSTTQEKPLRGLIASLIKREKQFSSASSMAQVARREITKSPRILAWLYKSEAMLQRLVEIQHKMVNDEFKELLEDGKPD